MEKYLPLIRKYITPLKRYVAVISITAIGAVYGYLVLTASQQANVRPSDDEVNNAYTKTSRPKLDDSAAKKLLQLESQNIDIQAIFDEARQNPFAE